MSKEKQLAETLMEGVHIRHSSQSASTMYNFDCPVCKKRQEGYYIPVDRELRLDFSVRCFSCERVFKVLSVEPFKISGSKEPK